MNAKIHRALNALRLEVDGSIVSSLEQIIRDNTISIDTDGLGMIVKERHDQLALGYDQSHDSNHKSGELMMLAEFLMKSPDDAEKDNLMDTLVIVHGFKAEYITKLRNLPRNQQLAKAGALIAAEIDQWQNDEMAPKS